MMSAIGEVDAVPSMNGNERRRPTFEPRCRADERCTPVVDTRNGHPCGMERQRIMTHEHEKGPTHKEPRQEPPTPAPPVKEPEPSEPPREEPPEHDEPLRARALSDQLFRLQRVGLHQGDPQVIPQRHDDDKEDDDHCDRDHETTSAHGTITTLPRLPLSVRRPIAPTAAESVPETRF